MAAIAWLNSLMSPDNLRIYSFVDGPTVTFVLGGESMQLGRRDDLLLALRGCLRPLGVGLGLIPDRLQLRDAILERRIFRVAAGRQDVQGWRSLADISGRREFEPWRPQARRGRCAPASNSPYCAPVR